MPDQKLPLASLEDISLSELEKQLSDFDERTSAERQRERIETLYRGGKSYMDLLISAQRAERRKLKQIFADRAGGDLSLLAPDFSVETLEPGYYWVRKRGNEDLTMVQLASSAIGAPLWVSFFGSPASPELSEIWSDFDFVAKVSAP